jgi:hypothetical protein
LTFAVELKARIRVRRSDDGGSVARWAVASVKA